MLGFALAILILAGCFRATVPEPATPPPPGDGDAGAGGVLRQLAFWATWAGGVLFIGSIAVAIYTRSARIAQLAVVALGVIAAAQVLYWVGSHMWVLGVAVALGALVVAYAARHKLEELLNKDLTGDDHIGDPTEKEWVPDA